MGDTRVKTLKEEVDDLIVTIARVSHVSTEEAVEIMMYCAKRFEHGTGLPGVAGEEKHGDSE